MGNNPLTQFKKSVTSQHGEDGVIEKIFEIIKPQNKWCVEFGAVDGKTGSNTWNLIINKGWQGVLIESHPAYFARLKKTYEGNGQVVALNECVGFEGEKTLDKLLAQTSIPKDFDFLSIDIDGNDYHVWKAVQTYNPRVVMIEFNFRIPASIEFVQSADEKVNWSSSLAALVKLGKGKGYELVGVLASNAFFVRKELFSLFNISDNSPKAFLGDSGEETRFFQLFDGSIVLYGLPRDRVLLYKKKPKVPLWVFENGKMFPVSITQNKKFIRFLKNVIKKIPFYYSVIYPFIERIYRKR